MKINLKKYSWIYKVAYGKKSTRINDDNLCRFFWKFVGNLLRKLTMYYVFSLLFGFLGLVIFLPCWEIYKTSSSIPSSVYVNVLYNLGKVICFMLGFIAIIFLLIAGKKIWKKSELRFVIKTYYRAKKQKYCPRVHFIEK